MLLREIQLQTNHLSVLYNFYKEVLELNTVYTDRKSIVVTAGKSKLIFKEADADVNPVLPFSFQYSFQ